MDSRLPSLGLVMDCMPSILSSSWSIASCFKSVMSLPMQATRGSSKAVLIKWHAASDSDCTPSLVSMLISYCGDYHLSTSWWFCSPNSYRKFPKQNSREARKRECRMCVSSWWAMKLAFTSGRLESIGVDINLWYIGLVRLSPATNTLRAPTCRGYWKCNLHALREFCLSVQAKEKTTSRG